VRPYAVTHRDTNLGEIASFFSGKYYTEGDGVYDIEGNFYKTVVINGLVWMAENLRTRTFCNGDTLVVSTSPAHFFEYNIQTTLYTLSFEFDENNDLDYGKYYAGRLALDERNICPCGWKIPHQSDVDQLANYVGNNSYLGGKMKSTGTLETGSGRWQHPNALATNLTGLSMNPGGYFYLTTAESSFFSMSLGFGNFMITRNHPFLNNQLAPSTILVQWNKGFLDYMNIVELQEYENIRCIKE
jgi:uncharacterized protein (TIGR02145 family)